MQEMKKKKKRGQLCAASIGCGNDEALLWGDLVSGLYCSGLLEDCADMSAAPFTLDRPQFDQSTWSGRTKHFFTITNPVFLFTSKADLDDAKDKLKRFQEGNLLPGTNDSDLWRARTMCDAVLHPDTQLPIPALFRISAFGPVNIPICAGMLMTAPTPFNIVFWQWVNQSYNAGFNYCNRNASSGLTNEKLAFVYAGATTVSVGLGLGLRKLATRAPASIAAAVTTAIPYCAVCSANVFNFVSMRSAELSEGIPVKDQDGNVLGKSQEAAKVALMQGAVTRCAIPAPVLILPPMIMRAIDSVKPPPRLRPAIELGVIVSCVWGALPCAIGLFPQEATLPVTKIEERFRNLKTKLGQPVEHVSFNKGV